MKTIWSLLISIICLTATAQRFEVPASVSDFKRHFSHSIEGGFVDNLPRQFVAGNMSDYLMSLNGARNIHGNSIDGITFLNGRQSAFPTIVPKILLTDFVVPPQGGNAQQAYGCGIYYPYGANSWAYPFFATIDRKTMQILNIVYYNLIYPNSGVPTNAGATRIKYSSRENAFYISGVMVDRVLLI